MATINRFENIPPMKPHTYHKRKIKCRLCGKPTFADHASTTFCRRCNPYKKRNKDEVIKYGY